MAHGRRQGKLAQGRALPVAPGSACSLTLLDSTRPRSCPQLSCGLSVCVGSSTPHAAEGSTETCHRDPWGSVPYHALARGEPSSITTHLTFGRHGSFARHGTVTGLGLNHARSRG